MAKNPVPLRWLTSCCLLSLAGLALQRPANAAVVWTATFESGAFMPDFSTGINNEGNVEVLGEQVFAGMYACKITVHPDDILPPYDQNRVDIQHQSTLTDEGSESWLSGHYFLPEDAKARNEIGFYESNTSYQNVMDFWVEPKEGGGTSLSFGVGFLGADVLGTVDFTASVWHQIAIYVLWSQDEATGRVAAWLDGVQFVAETPAKTKADGNTLFYQTGLHRTLPEDFTESIYIDNFIEADALADAQIMAPMMAGGSGGTGGGGAGGGGASGVGGAAGGSGGSVATGGAGGTPSTGGTAGSAVQGGSAGSAPTAMAGTSANAPSAATDSGGCGCRLRPTDGGLGAVSALLALLGLAAYRRRRR
jgi:MYXO-CTERM domain-containing protein